MCKCKKKILVSLLVLVVILGCAGAWFLIPPTEAPMPEEIYKQCLETPWYRGANNCKYGLQKTGYEDCQVIFTSYAPDSVKPEDNGFHIGNPAQLMNPCTLPAGSGAHWDPGFFAAMEKIYAGAPEDTYVIEDIFLSMVLVRDNKVLGYVLLEGCWNREFFGTAVDFPVCHPQVVKAVVFPNGDKPLHSVSLDYVNGQIQDLIRQKTTK